ncbi:hypothetical protein ACEPAG_2908 [Sanghuangporus baumii]
MISERASRQLSLRRVSFKTHVHLVRLLAEVYYCAIPDSYDDSASETLVLCLDRNKNIPNAIENSILDAFDSEGDLVSQRRPEIEAELLRLVQESLSSIERFFMPATRISIRTEPGNRMTYSVNEDNEFIFPSREIPRALAVLRTPTAQITSLKRLGPVGRFGITEGIDRVLWGGHEGVFAFKRPGRDANTTAHEIELLRQSPLRGEGSAKTLPVSAIVVDARERLRGFLSPFEPYGSMEEVFTNRRHLAAGQASLGNIGSIAFPQQLEWKEKLGWAAQLARGVATLHDGHSILGQLTLRNLNPRNVLVSGTASSMSSRNTYLIIAGFRGAASPTGMRYSKRWAAPERWRRSTYEIGTALDVANLGMTLWAVAEENFDGFPDIYSEDSRHRSSSNTSRRGGPVQQGRSDLWRKDNPATPGWYRLLIESCVEEEPARRPKAAEVASAIERHLQLPSS